MKKLFLTSGIIACMACPAFATVNDGVANIAAEALSANCDSTTLETSTAGDTSNFTAMWRKHEGTFSFDNNIAWTNTCSTPQNISHTDATATQTNLYSRYDTGVWTSDARTGDPATTMTVPSRDGYTFNGYYDNSSLTGSPVIGSTGTISNGVNLANLITADGGTATLYASWTPETYSDAVTFSCGSVTTNNEVSNVLGSVASLSPTYDDCFTMPAVTGCTAPAGYTFQGWSCGTAITGLIANANADTNNPNLYDAGAGATWTMDRSGQSAIQCTAIWGRNSIGLTYTVDGQSYTAGNPSPSCDYGTAIGTLPTDPSKTGYTFTGWDVTSVTH